MQYFLLLSPASQFSGFCETSNGLFMQKIPKLEFIQNSNLRLNIQNKVQEVLGLRCFLRLWKNNRVSGGVM